jgi:hypothetical protein
MAVNLEDAEVKAAIKTAVEAAIAEATEGLKAKNVELLAKLKKAQKDATIDPADHAALQSELEATQAKLAETAKALKTATSEAEKVKKSYESESQLTHRLLVDNGLTDALTKAGVTNPVHLRAAKAMLSGQVQLIAEGENRIAKVGEKPLADYVGEWAKGDEGKYFVAAQQNTGGGAMGGNGKGAGAKTLSRTAFDGLDASAKVKFIAEGGNVTDAA